MQWEAVIDTDVAESGTLVHLDRGYGDDPPQPGDDIHLANPKTGEARSVTVISSTADRLEINDGPTIVSMKISSLKRPAILNQQGKYYEAWVVDQSTSKPTTAE